MAIRFAQDAGGRLTGTNSRDLLWGGDGADRIFGLDGADYLYGGYGDDRLDGGSGSDHLRGAAGSDRLWGGSGADLLAGGSDADYFIFRAADGPSADTVRDFTVGEDRLVLGGGLRVSASRWKDVDGDGDTDTILTLSNSGTIVLLGVDEPTGWGVAGPNAMALSDLLA
ncbi:calcium-binding protein [Paracoccus shandongensis]|uniref:calcium-binding protein n=1 Tax=Paracoccus shandongensis TaxID=2816048 RepID=UPI001A8DDC6C|nr:hypothetical protein [Paracoccus shandongensis]